MIELVAFIAGSLPVAGGMLAVYVITATIRGR